LYQFAKGTEEYREYVETDYSLTSEQIAIVAADVAELKAAATRALTAECGATRSVEGSSGGSWRAFYPRKGCIKSL
jgi:hypothetical protein